MTLYRVVEAKCPFCDRLVSVTRGTDDKGRDVLFIEHDDELCGVPADRIHLKVRPAAFNVIHFEPDTT